MINKQQIIKKHIGSINNRAIAEILKLSKDRVTKYVREYHEQKAALIAANPTIKKTLLIVF